MDLEAFANSDLRDKRGLYIVSMKDQSPPWNTLYRVGRAGGNDHAGYDQNDPSYGNMKGSTYNSRAQMYLANWPMGGKIHAALDLQPLRAPKGHRVVAMAPGTVVDVPHKLKSANLIGHSEHVLHRILDASDAVTRFRGRREWFQVSNVQILKDAMKQVGRGLYYDFTGGFMPEPEKLTVDIQDPAYVEERLLQLRTSPRLGELNAVAIRVPRGQADAMRDRVASMAATRQQPARAAKTRRK